MSEARDPGPWGVRGPFFIAALLAVGGILIAVAAWLFPPVRTSPYYGGQMMGGGSLGLMALLPLIFLLFVFLLLISILAPRPPSRAWEPGPVPTSARELLDRRYAGGKLSHKQYLRIRDDLDGSASPHL